MPDQDVHIDETETQEEASEQEEHSSRYSRALLINIAFGLVLVLAVAGLLYYWNASRIFIPNAFDVQEGRDALNALSDTTEEAKIMQEIDELNFKNIDADMKSLDVMLESL